MQTADKLSQTILAEGNVQNANLIILSDILAV
jgi:hypothetical protein